MLGARVIAVAVGYCFGLFQTGYIYGEKHGVDIRTQGSGNAGTTNTLRVLGWKAGLITFLGDLFKAIFAVLLIRFIFIGKYPEFKGGKGIACTSGMILAVCPLAAPICLILFIGSIAITRYVSLGSILVVTSYLIQVLIFGHMGYLHVDTAYLPEFYIVSACFTAMALWRHKANIKRLLTGTENKFGMKKN